MNTPKNLFRKERLLAEMSGERRSSKPAATQAPTMAHPNKLAGSADPAAEKARVAEIVERLRAWLKVPTLPLPLIVELTGLSRSRVITLAEQGLFERKQGEFIVASVQQHFVNRLSILAAAARFSSKSKAR